METIILNSCSKINLGLNIIKKRDDGYHDIETIFYPVQLCDTISFKKSKEFKFICRDKILFEDNNNLIIRAKNKLEKITGEKIKAEISLAKYIPLGGGLGGGSSNAASTLNGLDKLFQFNLSEEILMKAALELGSDVPFFLKFKPSYASSRGESLKEINLKIENPILIVNPKIHVSTRWAFENIEPSKPVTSLMKILEDGIKLSRFREYINNDFEKVVFYTFPEIGKIKEDLYSAGAIFSLMSGSGSTVFGIFDNIEDAVQAQNNLNSNYITFIHYEKY